jgi:Rrf2 family protein
MALPRRAALALLAALDVALNARGGLVSARDIAKRHGLPPRTFETILGDLARAGLVRGTRGPRGGYQLARERRRISAADVVRAVGLADATDALPESGAAMNALAPVLAQAEAALFASLGTRSLDDLIALIPREDRPAMDFTI